jgi:hypothetical protein
MQERKRKSLATLNDDIASTVNYVVEQGRDGLYPAACPDCGRVFCKDDVGLSRHAAYQGRTVSGAGTGDPSQFAAFRLPILLGYDHRSWINDYSSSVNVKHVEFAEKYI